MTSWIHGGLEHRAGLTFGTLSRGLFFAPVRSWNQFLALLNIRQFKWFFFWGNWHLQISTSLMYEHAVDVYWGLRPVSQAVGGSGKWRTRRYSPRSPRCTVTALARGLALHCDIKCRLSMAAHSCILSSSFWIWSTFWICHLGFISKQPRTGIFLKTALYCVKKYNLVSD